MTSNQILGASMLDILFDNRNKMYGAYELRKHYHSRLLIAMGTSLTLVFLLIFLLNSGQPASEKIMSVQGHDYEITEVVFPQVKEIDPIVPRPPVAPAAPSAVTSFSLIQMVDDPSPEHAMAAITDIEKSVIGGENINGIDDHSFQSIVPSDPVLSGDGKTRNEEMQTEFIAVEEQPEFPGGAVAWRNFLSRYLQVPGSLNGGELKTVKINFMVDVDGSVTRFTILQSAGREFDNEVIRVLKMMPRWKPALQNGRPVAVPFTQPVTFVGTEQ